MTGFGRLTWVGIAACWLHVAAAGATAAEALAVPLHVDETQGLARRQAPISGGIPLPRGRFRAGQAFSLTRQDGRPVPVQILPLVVETDGTLRWVLADFQDDLEAHGRQDYRLRAEPSAVSPPQTLQIEDRPDAVAIDTGQIRLSISRTKPFGLFESVSVGGRALVTEGSVRYERADGRRGWDDAAPWKTAVFSAAAPQAVNVVYRGPLRATVEVRGRFAGDPLQAGYQAWITVWAGHSRVGVKYKLCNSNPDQYTAILVQRAVLELHLAGDADRVLVGAKEPLDAGREGWLHQGLLLHADYQDIPGAVQAGSGSRVLWTGNGPADRPAGWIATTGPAPLLVSDRLFATNPARRLSAGGRTVLLEPIAARFSGPRDRKFGKDRPVGQPWQAEGFWLYDCSHHSSEYLFDFDPPAEPDGVVQAAAAAQERLWAVADGSWYSQCEVLGVGRFGTSNDELASYERWGWQVPPRLNSATAPRPAPGVFVAGEDNHYESEADSVQGLLLMYLRTGQRGWFDLAEAWARYHMDLQAWRTDGWAWRDGAIWFPSGGPQGNMPVRQKWNFQWGPNWGEREKNPDCIDLWRQAQSKSCYCHFYGSGLADFFCLTGDRDALEAARDDVEQKDEEFRRFRKFTPGRSEIGCIRGFGRGFEVMMRVLQADPGNERIRDLCHLAARTLWESPRLDERGFHPSLVGGGFGGMPVRELTPAIRRWMDEHGVGFTTEGDTVDQLTQGSQRWPVVCFGGTWQHLYIQNGADLYAAYFDDEDLRDFVVAFAQMSRRYMLSPKCRQTWYYTYFDVPDRGQVFDPWAFEHTGTQDGEGCVHSGWYTRFYPDACAKGYSWTGDASLLEKARDFWYFGSKREYQTKQLSGRPQEVHRLAGHQPPKDDTVLSTSRLFYEASQRRADDQPPEAIRDLTVRLLADGQAEIRFTAPRDQGGGRVARYQLKMAELPIVDYDAWDPVRDAGQKRNWWRAINCPGEPPPAAPGTVVRFVVGGLPAGNAVYFAVRSYDDRWNCGPLGNLARLDRRPE